MEKADNPIIKMVISFYLVECNHDIFLFSILIFYLKAIHLEVGCGQ